MRKALFCLTFAIVLIMSIVFSIGLVQAGPCELPDFSVDNFDSNPQSPTYSANITNPYMPLEVGKIFTYEPVPNPDNVVNTVIVMDIIHTITVGGKKQMPVFKGQRFISI